MAAPTIGQDWEGALRMLEPGWDSYSSVKITDEAISTVKRLHTVPMSDGGILLALIQDGLAIEIEIEPSGRVGLFLINNEKSKS